MRSDTVLITRPEPGASGTAARLVAMGLTPVVAPVLEIRRHPLRYPGARVAAVLLASGNAVESLPASLHGVPALTVGAATARRAEQAGFSRVISADGDAVALAALVRERYRPDAGTLLLAAGQGSKSGARGRPAGVRISGRPPGRLRRDPGGAAAGARQSRADGGPVGPTVLLFSAETARHFLRLTRRAGLLEALARHEAITIGPQAAMALRDVTWARIRVAAKPTQDEMLALLR